MHKEPKKATFVWGIILAALGVSSFLSMRTSRAPELAHIIFGIILVAIGGLLLFFYLKNKKAYDADMREAEKILGFSPKIVSRGENNRGNSVTPNQNYKNTTTYCTNCGMQMPKSAKYCPSCGAINQSKHVEFVNQTDDYSKENNDRKQEYTGVIYKCPNCGEIIQSFQTHCPSCGLELREVKATSSVREFASKLESVETYQNRISLIQNFPIPNTKEDLLEFMILARSNINLRAYDNNNNSYTSQVEKSLNDAWLSKVKQVYEKAMQSNLGEKERADIQRLYEECGYSIKQTKKKRVLKWVLLVGWMPVVFIIVFLIVTPIVHRQNANEETRLTTIVEDVETALAEKDYRLALRHAESIEYEGDDSERERWWSIKKEDLIDDIIEEAEKDGIHLERTPEVETQEETTQSGSDKLKEEWNNFKDTVDELQEQNEEN